MGRSPASPMLDRNVKLLLATSAILSASMGLYYPFMSEYVYALTGSAYLAGVVASIRGVACAIAFIAGGRLADLAGRRGPIWAGTAMLGASQLLYSAVGDAAGLMAASAIEGLSYFYFPAFNAAIMDSAGGREEAVWAFTWSVVASHVPYALTPIVGGLLRDVYGVAGLRLSLIASGLTTICVAVVRLRGLEETLASRRRLGARWLLEAYIGAASDLRRLHRSVRRLIALRATTLISAISMFEVFSILYATRYLGAVSFTEWGALQALASASLLASIPLSRLAARLRPSRAYPALVASKALAPMLFMGPSPIAMAASLSLLNVAGSLTYSLERALVASTTKPELRGRAEAYMNMSFYVGSALGSLIGGLLYALSPPLTLIASSALLCLGAALSPTIFAHAAQTS